MRVHDQHEPLARTRRSTIRVPPIRRSKKRLNAAKRRGLPSHGSVRPRAECTTGGEEDAPQDPQSDAVAACRARRGREAEERRERPSRKCCTSSARAHDRDPRQRLAPRLAVRVGLMSVTARAGAIVMA